jgi:alkanesulfonate monooxygenase SsuD/methylene tetrahydromethanopterin reductase-like flavin-dependent oxidoreductase (luciferase family)
MKISLWLPNTIAFDEALSIARWAEAKGYDGIWYADHLMPNQADGSVDGRDTLECWTVLAAIGALVPRVRLVSMVSPVTIHHPVLLAKRAATVSQIAQGRTVLGMGAGWQVNEHRAYGFELPDAGPRVDRFAEALELVHTLVRSERTTFTGAYYQLDDAPFAPKAVGELPLLVGTASPRMQRLTARWADEWNTWGDPDTVAEATARFFAACEREQRDPSTVRRSAQALMFLGDAGAAALPGRTLSGSVEQLTDALGRYEQQGLHEFALPGFTLGRTPAERLDTLEALHQSVLHRFI